MRDIKKEYKSELSIRNRLGRAAWIVVFFTLYKIAPRPFHGWRRFWLCLFGAKIDRKSRVLASARIWAPWNLSMGANSILGDRVDCYSVAPINIMNGAVVSQDACLCAATHDYKSPDFTLVAKPITVHAGAWVAARAFVGPGVTVGEGAVLGACAVAFKDIPDGVTAVGNPVEFFRPY